MGTIGSFEEIDAWRNARVLTQHVYRVTSHGSFRHDFGLKDQIRRASVSVMANIAEGFERDGKGEFLQFLSIAKGSCGEVRTHLYVAFDLGYVDQQTFDQLTSLARKISRQLHGFIQYLRRSQHAGTKFRTQGTVAGPTSEDHQPET